MKVNVFVHVSSACAEALYEVCFLISLLSLYVVSMFGKTQCHDLYVVQ